MQHGCWTPSVKLGTTRLYLSQSTDIKVVVTIDKYISKIAYTSTCTSAKTLGMCTNICTDIARAVCNDSAFMSTEISLLLFIDILRHQKAARGYSASSESNHATKWLHGCWTPTLIFFLKMIMLHSMSCNVKVKRLSPGKDCGLGIADEKTKRMREGILGTRMRREGVIE